MKPYRHDLRRTSSRLCAAPLPSKPYELLAIVGAVLCLVAHFLAIRELNELAAHGGILRDGVPQGLRLAIGFSIAGFAVSLLALLRIWWRGHRHQGTLLAAYGLIVNPYLLYMVRWVLGREFRGDGHLTQSDGIVTGLCFGALLIFVYTLLTRPLRARHGPPLAVGLFLLLATGATGGAWGAVVAYSKFASTELEAYLRILPESTTATPWIDVTGDGPCWSLALGAEPDGTPIYGDLQQYLPWGEFFIPQRDVFENLFDDPEDPREWLRNGMDEFDEVVLEELHVPRQLWLDNSLYVGLPPGRPAGQLLELSEFCRGLFPERRLNLLVCRRLETDWKRALLGGARRRILRVLPLEIAVIPGAPELHVEGVSGRLRLVLDLVELESELALTALLARGSTEGVNLQAAPELTLAEVVRAIDLVRSAGVERIALP